MKGTEDELIKYVETTRKEFGELSAEEIAFVSGPFRRNISIETIERFARTGEASGLISDVINFTNDEPEEVLRLINQKFELPIVLTSKLINSKIGKVVLTSVSKII